MNYQYHTLLRRQLRKIFQEPFSIPEKWQSFIDAVNTAYCEFDTDRNMLERSLELSSQELLQANSEMRAIFETLPDLFFRLRNDGTIIDCKAGNTSDLYISREKIIGKKIDDIPIPEVGTKFHDAIRRIQMTSSSIRIEYSILIDDEENFCEARLLPLLEDQIIVLIRNVTEQKNAEKALRESEEKYRSIVEESHFGVYVIQDGRFKFVNKRFCEIHGYEYDEIVNKLLPEELISPEDLSLVAATMRKISRGDDKSSQLNFSIRHKSGELRSIKAFGTKILYKGRPAITGTVIDTSKERVLEGQLIQSQKMETVGRLAGGIAHDFNNILGIILGNSQLAKMNLAAESDTRIYEYLTTIEGATARAADFVKQLLAFSRQQVLDLKVVDLNDIAVSFEKMVRRAIGEHIEIRIISRPELPRIKADIAQINQILLNLVINARDAMPNGGKLSIDITTVNITNQYYKSNADASPGCYVVLSVTDTGIGMHKDMVNKIFEPFFTTKKSGSGLGLSVVFGLVKQHGGFVNVYSELGVGTTFKVYFPSIQEAIEAPEETAKPIQGGMETILIVEDEIELLEIAAEMLQLLGYRVLLASNGEEGIEIFKKKCDEIQLVLIDVVMPKMNGRETYEEMKKIKPSVRPLFVTGYSLGGIHTNFILEEGIDAVQKPYSLEILSSKIREIIDRT
jgi:two-component system, cell cycle sensor histidine kinase and response regulator CckA